MEALLLALGKSIYYYILYQELQKGLILYTPYLYLLSIDSESRETIPGGRVLPYDKDKILM